MGSGMSKRRPEANSILTAAGIPSVDQSVAQSQMPYSMGVEINDSSAIQEVRRQDADPLERIQRLETENSQLRSANADLEVVLTNMRDEVQNLKAENSRLLSEIKVLQECKPFGQNATVRLSELQEDFQQRKDENSRLRSAHTDSEGEIQHGRVEKCLFVLTHSSAGVTARLQDELSSKLVETETLSAELSRLKSQNNAQPEPKSVATEALSAGMPCLVDEPLTALKRQLDEQVQLGFKRRDESVLLQVFEKFCVKTRRNDKDCETLPKEQLLAALEQVGRHIPQGKRNLDSLMRDFDLNSDGLIDFDEFKAAAQMQSPLSQWARGLPFAEIFADAIPKRHLDEDPLRAISSLAPVERDAVHDAFCLGVKGMLDAESHKLIEAFKILDQKASAGANSAAPKFQVYPMSCGKVDDYHKGLASRVGHPHIKFIEAMEAEHCTRPGCDHEFVTDNYKIKTTPEREWKITVQFDMSGLTDVDRAFGRRLVEMEVHMKCRLVTESKLERAEVIAVVLYTGPMYVVWNCILRRWPEELFKVFSKGGNVFSTTINVLVSAVQKVSRSVKLPEKLPLLRGLGGNMDLPDHYHKPDEQGRRGFVEWGFMSMTSSKATAIQYSGVGKEDKPQPMMLEAQSGALARGACIQDLSQYPQEVEYLFPPCSLVEPHGAARLEVTEVGVLMVMPVSITPNVKTLTLHEHLQHKKLMHLATFEFLLTQLGPEMQAAAEQGGLTMRITKGWPGQSAEYYSSQGKGLLDKIGEQGHEFFVTQKGRAVEDFTDDDKYRGMVVQMLKVKTMAMAKLQLYLDDDLMNFHVVTAMSLGEAYRRQVALLRGREGAGDAEAARRLCRLEGLEYEGVNELSEPPLVSAVKEDLPLVRKLKLLASASANLDATDGEGHMALHAAAEYGYTDAVAALIDLKADVKACEKERGQSALHFAGAGGHVDTARLLLEKQADVNTVDNSAWTPLMTAAHYGKAEGVGALIAAKANVNAKTDMGDTPLMKATSWYNGGAKAVGALIDAKANVNAEDNRGWTSLLNAAYNGKVEAIGALIAAKANVNARNKVGWTALTGAGGNPEVSATTKDEVVEALRAAGATESESDEDSD